MGKKKEEEITEDKHSDDDEDYIVGSDAEMESDDELDDESGGLGDILSAFLCTSEQENLAEVCKQIQHELHTLNKTLKVAIKNKTS